MIIISASRPTGTEVAHMSLEPSIQEAVGKRFLIIQYISTVYILKLNNHIHIYAAFWKFIPINLVYSFIQVAVYQQTLFLRYCQFILNIAIMNILICAMKKYIKILLTISSYKKYYNCRLAITLLLNKMTVRIVKKMREKH